MSLTATKMISALGILQKYPLPINSINKEKEATVEWYDMGIYLIGVPAREMKPEDIRGMLELGFTPSEPLIGGTANWEFQE